jgi:Xaa-Pro aminopeptidase
VDFFTLKRDYRKIGEIRGMPLNEVRMVLDDNQLEALRQIAKIVDIVLVPFPVLTSLREQSIREQFPNVVAFNATTETQRSAPQDKVVDVNNWSY